jgi:hypothetical protein
VQSTASRTDAAIAAQKVAATISATPLTPINDAKVFNASFDWEQVPGLPKYIQDLIGGPPIRGNPVLPQGDNTLGTVRWQLDAGVNLNVGSDGIITFGFFDAKHTFGINNKLEGKGYTPFNDAQKAAARVAVHNWDDLIDPDFVETEFNGRNARDWAQDKVDILLANTTTGPAQAWAYYPNEHQYKRAGSDVWIADPRFNTSNGQLDPGFYGLQTLNHELGHTLGLSHPGAYDFGDDNDGDGQPDPITYNGDAFYFQDSHQFTIMSYFDTFETGAQPVDWNLMRFVYPSTPMVDDVFVSQQKYGAELTTRTGNTTYGFNATDDVWNPAMRFQTGEMATIFTIWDAGGIDTLNLSGYYTPSVIDLREGGYSSAGGFGAYNATQAALNVDALTKDEYLSYINPANAAIGLGARTAAYDLYFGGRAGANEGIPWNEIVGSKGGPYLMEQNIGIAFGAIVENAIGGHGNDRINGNQANNQFTGNGGSDTFIIADYSGAIADAQDTVDWSKTVDDESVDTIMDFESGIDKIDLTELKGADGLAVDWSDLSVSGNTWTVERGADDLSFVVLGGTAVQADFIFG